MSIQSRAFDIAITVGPRDVLPTPTSASIIFTTVTNAVGSAQTDVSTSVLAVDAPPTPSLTASNLELIACTSAIGGLVLIIFLIFVLYQLRKGRNLIDILKLRRSHTDEQQDPRLLDTIEQPSSGLIFKSQRFSIRSSRYTMSLHDNKSRRVSQASPSPYRQYEETYFLSTSSAARPTFGPRSKQTPPVPPLQTDLDKLPNLSTISKPEMAHMSDREPINGSTTTAATKGVTAGRKGNPRCLTVTTRPMKDSVSTVVDNRSRDYAPSISTTYTAMDVIDENKASLVYERPITPFTPTSPDMPKTRSSVIRGTVGRVTHSDLPADLEKGALR
ncbi:hypothetical protein MBLNU457_5857t1 [Dothideomycetes sp. NU457]